MKYKITVGDLTYSETFIGIEFINGVGFTEDKKLANYLKETFKYQVEEIKPSRSQSKKGKQGDKNV